jgi:hypothetical protein
MRPSFAVLALSLFAGCSHPVAAGVVESADDTLHFTPVKTDFQRFASTCGVQNPPFQDADVYSLDLYGSGSYSTGTTGISVGFERTVPIGQDIAVALQPFGVQSFMTDASGRRQRADFGHPQRRRAARAGRGSGSASDQDGLHRRRRARFRHA